MQINLGLLIIWPWFSRGGSRNSGKNAGVFASGADRGSANSEVGFRVVLSI